MKKTQPIRMCITCRSRHPQNTLIRVKHMCNEVVAYDGQGRSFYLCLDCVKNEKKVKGLVKRFKQDAERFVKLLTELALKVSTCEKSHLN